MVAGGAPLWDDTDPQGRYYWTSTEGSLTDGVGHSDAVEIGRTESDGHSDAVEIGRTESDGHSDAVEIGRTECEAHSDIAGGMATTGLPTW